MRSIVIYALLGVVMLTGLGLRTWNVNFDGGLNAHPDERHNACLYAPNIGWPSSLDEFLDPQRSPLNPLWDRENDRRLIYAYGHFPLYLGILTGELLNSLAKPARLLPLSDRTIALMERANTPCAGVTVAGRLLMALLDTLTILLLFLLGRRLYGAAGGLLAAGLYAFTAQTVQLSHFFAMDPASTTFITLAVYGSVLMVQERSWRGVLYAGIGAGLATSAKFSALPILALPFVAALIALWPTGNRRTHHAEYTKRSRHGVGRLLVDATIALLLACAAFFITSPYAVLEWSSFIQNTLVGPGKQVASGTIDTTFTRQYRNTIPYLYFIQQQVVWGMGLPLGLIALAGSGWALVKVLWLRARAGELIVWTWVIPYFGITGAFLAKFNRYMSPVLPFVLLFAAGMIVWLWRLGAKRYSDGSQLRLAARFSAAFLALIALGGGLFWSLAYVNGVYANEHTWITASRWVYANVPNDSVILYERWPDPLPKSIPGEPGMDMGSHGLQNIVWEAYGEDTPEKYNSLLQQLRAADYLIYSSNHVYKGVNELPERYPMTIRYHELMFGEQLGFTHAADITSPPRLFGLTFPDHEADESWSLYDHPRVSIFAKQRDLTDAEFDVLLGGSWEGAIAGFRGKDSLFNSVLSFLQPFIQRARALGQPLYSPSASSGRLSFSSGTGGRCDTLSDSGALCYCGSRSVPGEWPSQFSREGQPTVLGDATTHQVTLLGWELLKGQSPQPTDTVVVRLYWQPHGPINEELHSFLHLYTPSLQRSWAVAHNRRPSCQPATDWHPGNYYVDDLRLSIPVDTPPVTYSLVVGLVSSDGARLAVSGSTDDVLHLRALAVSPLTTGFFQRRQFLRQERPTIVAPAETDDGLRLQGYDLLPAPGAPTLRLFWETGEGVASDWITYIHLHSPQGERIAQFDGPALAGLQPTSQWQTDSLYIDRRQLVLPGGLEPGDYLLRIGLYNFESGERLPFRPDFGDGQGHFEAGQLLVPLSVPEGSDQVSGT